MLFEYSWWFLYLKVSLINLFLFNRIRNKEFIVICDNNVSNKLNEYIMFMKMMK